MKKAILILSILLLGISTVSSAAEPIILGVSAAFTGPSRGLGIELYRGSMAYFSYINDNGGIRGQSIQLKLLDDGYNPYPCIKNTVRLIETEEAFLLFNYVGTPTVTRILPLLRRYEAEHVYLFFPFTGAQPQREAPYDRYAFNLRASYRQETAGLVDQFIKIGRRKIAVFYQADAYGRSGWAGVRFGLKNHNLDIVGEATYRRGAEYNDSMTEQVEILKRANPDAIICVGAYAACAAFIRDARLFGWDIPIANLSFVGSENLARLLISEETRTGRRFTDNLINSQVVPSYEDLSISAVKEYRKLMETYAPPIPEQFQEDAYDSPEYSFVSFEGFLNAKLLVEILKRLPQPLRKRDIVPTVESMPVIDLGVGVPIKFSKNRHQASSEVYFTTLKDGKFIPIDDWSRWIKNDV